MVKVLNAALTGLLDAGMVRDCSSGDLGIIVLAHRLLAGQTAATALRMGMAA